LGVYDTMRAAALVNMAVGVVAIATGRAGAHIAPPDEEEREPEAGERSAVHALVAAASGLLVFSAEVVDTHLLALLIGNSAYAFGLMLAVFLTCLSIGAKLAEPLDRRLGEKALPVGLRA